MEGVGNYGADITGASINAMKKAMNTQEIVISKVLESASAENSQMQTSSPISEGAAKTVSDTLNKGGGLNLMA